MTEPETTIYRITARVRKSGALGVFYSQQFNVEGPVGLTEDQVKARWFIINGDDWELDHVERISAKDPHTT